MFLTLRERLCVNEVHEFFTNWAVPWHRQLLVAHYRGPDLIVGSLICDLDMVTVREAFLHILSLL